MPDWRRYVRDHLPRLDVRPEREAEIIGELAVQLEQTYADSLTGGSPPAEALARAGQQFPDWAALAREINAAERHVPPPIENAPNGLWRGLRHDLHYAARLLRKNPAFAALAIGTLAFGIGANTTIFTIVDAIALRGLPYPNSNRLVAIESYEAQRREVGAWSSIMDFFDVRERQRSFDRMSAVSPVWNLVLTGRGDAERLECLYVSADFFPMLGVQPALGRAFVAKEDNRSRPSNVVLLSYAFWQRRFGGDRSVIGQTLNLDGSATTVIGVMPAGFRYLGEPLLGTTTEVALYMPLASNQLANANRAIRFLKVIGQLKPGVSAIQANDDIHRIGLALASQFPDSNRGLEYEAALLSTRVSGRVRTTLFLLLGAVGFVLLMACANVANLLLVRAAARSKEISIRIALGATRWRLLRQLLSEGFLLAAIGGAAGFALAAVLLKLLIAAGPASLLRTREIGLDTRALLFTTGIILLSTILAGIPPAWRVMRSDAANYLRAAGRGFSAGMHLLRSGLVVTQVALALSLLVGAGLLIHSFVRLLDVNPGFNVENLITISTQTPQSEGSPAKRTAVLQLMRERLLATAGVQNVGAASRLPLMGQNLGSSMFVEGSNLIGADAPTVEYRVATPDYFPTMGIPLRRGRLFDDHDGATSDAVLVNETLARRFLDGGNPIGKRIKLGPYPDRQPWLTIVGVIGDIRHVGLDVEPRAEAYRPYAAGPLFAPILVIRTTRDPGPLISSMTAAIRTVHSAIPTYNIFRLEELVERSTVERRFTMSLLAGFAFAALLLAAIGIYGAISQSVAQRTQEIGLRMALGAQPAAALRMVFGEAMRLTAIGSALGLLGAVAITRAMRSLLFDVSPLDPTAFVAAALVLPALAIVAAYAPARRATRVDPLVALRHE